MSDLLHEWVTIPVDCQAWRDLPKLGVPWTDLNRCGDPLPGRVRTDGVYFEPCDPNGAVMLIQPAYVGPVPSIFNPVESPCIGDLIAYSPRDPGRWYWRRGEHGLVLGDEVLEGAELFGEPVRLFRTPWAWLQAGGRGACLLDHSPGVLDRLRHVCEIIVDDLDYGLEIEKRLRQPAPTNPKISIVDIEKEAV